MPRNPKSVDELEDPGHLAHQRREWIVERVGWAAMLALVAAAMLGFLGPGPLTRFTALAPDGSLSVHYRGVERNAAAGEIRFRIGEQARVSETVRLLVHRTFVDATTDQEFEPPPRDAEAHGPFLVYTFRIADLAGEERIVYRYQHEEFGRFQRQFALEGSEPVLFVQWVLP